ncbi:MAG: mechanosensitive ion channel family protein, partial [Desulfopila sp.]
LAIFFWQFISNWIARKIEEATPAQPENSEDEEDEWGAAANRGRSFTLLPMLRRFIGTILITMVTMTILSSMGVDIGPLLAGAGVVGLAVGFGAQKLVADMFSGFFYLLDDAFRVGEYIEAGGVTGTVESISLRNVMLRHHRGMLQIVPHSELGAITNYMRGGIIVKFNLDFPYDANIDKIRKVIKKVGQAMLEEDEFKNDFIRPVKSQGVREIANSVMTIRVKFTAKPGSHFLIRREAYKRITEALRAQGINYAHRKVIVDIPLSADAGNGQIAQAAGAAAQSILESEAEQKRKAEPADTP